MQWAYQGTHAMGEFCKSSQKSLWNDRDAVTAQRKTLDAIYQITRSATCEFERAAKLSKVMVWGWTSSGKERGPRQSLEGER